METEAQQFIDQARDDIAAMLARLASAVATGITTGGREVALARTKLQEADQWLRAARELPQR